MRSAPLLLALTACDPATPPAPADADAWRDIAALGECHHQIAYVPADPRALVHIDDDSLRLDFTADAPDVRRVPQTTLTRLEASLP